MIDQLSINFVFIKYSSGSGNKQLNNNISKAAGARTHDLRDRILPDGMRKVTTVKGRVTGLSSGACRSKWQALRRVGIVTTSEMGTGLLQIPGIKDCGVQNVWEKRSIVRARDKSL